MTKEEQEQMQARLSEAYEYQQKIEAAADMISLLKEDVLKVQISLTTPWSNVTIPLTDIIREEVITVLIKEQEKIIEYYTEKYKRL